ncbi:MAG: hypothetical protein KAR06_08090 [Deltaproteobacteria bacterium]|nr:hypothetical protein [Deltaproteobacteria bacterium]
MLQIVRDVFISPGSCSVQISSGDKLLLASRDSLDKTIVCLSFLTDTEDISQINEMANFYTVRGPSAALPQLKDGRWKHVASIPAESVHERCHIFKEILGEAHE